MSLGAPPVFTSLCALRGVQTDMSIFSKHLANEVAGRGVRINRVTRGACRAHGVSDADGCGTTGDERPVRADRTPEAVAVATVYVVSDASA